MVMLRASLCFILAAFPRTGALISSFRWSKFRASAKHSDARSRFGFVARFAGKLERV